PRVPTGATLTCEQFNPRNLSGQAFYSRDYLVWLAAVFAQRGMKDLFDALFDSVVSIAACGEPALFGTGAGMVAEPHSWLETNACFEERQLVWVPGRWHFDPYERDGSKFKSPSFYDFERFGWLGLDDPQKEYGI